MNEETLLAEALRRDSAERALFLEQACGANAELRQRIEKLLVAHHKAGGLRDKHATWLEGAGDAVPGQRINTNHLPEMPPEGVGSLIGPYKLLQQIGEGGMGIVYMAEQQEPVRRMVALKVIKAGMDSAQVIARFEQERQALALMDHPNIAKALDARTTASGRPYFVMELVEGIPITKYCDEQRLSPKQRLELFVPVCQAIQHAHQKGIIHRDLKPSNVLIAAYDGKPVPKVIDFGVAKAAGQKLTERTLLTGFGGLIGTLEYMSPEQAEFNAVDIDTRSDVYSLGVLLYELLTGSTPLSWQRIKDADLMDVLRLIREEEPRRPSTRLSELKDSITSVSAQRQLEPAALVRSLRGEVDWIVMKALEKDRTRRYDAAIGFARDIQRYLAEEPVEAGPPSATYRLRKLAWKHRRSLTTTAALLLLLIAGAVLSTALAVWAMRAEKQAVIDRDRALSAEMAAEQQRDAAQAAERATAKERDRAVHAEREMERKEADTEAVLRFFQEKVLSAGRPKNQDGGQGRDVKLREAVDMAEEKIADAFKDRPAVEASIRDTLGTTYFYLGDYPQAIRQLKRVLAFRETNLGPDHPNTVTTRSNLAGSYWSAGRTDEAIRLNEQILKQREVKLGPDHPNTLISRNNLALAYESAGRAAQAIRLHERTLKQMEATLGVDHPNTLNSRNNLANAYRTAGRTAEAIRLHEQNLKQREAKLGRGHPDTLFSRNNLALAYGSVGRTAEAIRLLEQTLKQREAKLGPNHPDTLSTRNSLANAYQSAGRTAEAISLLEQTLKQREAHLGADHSDALQSRSSLANAYYSAGRTAEALPLYEKTLEQRMAKLGADHPETLRCRNNLANAYRSTGRIAEAIRLHEQTLKQMEAKLGGDHPETLRCRNNLAGAYWSARKLDRSIPHFEEALRRMKAKLGPDHPDTLVTLANLGVNYRDAGRMEEGLALLEEAHQSGRKRSNGFSAELAWIPGALADTYDRAGRFAKSEPFYRAALEQTRKRCGAEDVRTAGQMAILGANLLHQHKYADVEPLLRDCLKVRQAKQPDHWATFNTQSSLGAALLGQKKYADAEPLLLAGYQGMRQREEKIPLEGKDRLREALQRLVHLYEATGNKDEADRWRGQLESATQRPDKSKP